MRFIEREACFVSIADFTLSSTDEEVLSSLYLPLIGSGGFSLYRYLLSLSAMMDRIGEAYILDLINNLHVDDFSLLESFRKIEAIGLLCSYRKTNSDGKGRYVFRLYPPANPSKFFMDPLLKGLLVDRLGEKKVGELSFFFMTKQAEPLGYEDVTSKVFDVFTLKEGATIETDSLFVEKSYRKVADFPKEKLRSLLIQASSYGKISPYFDEICSLASIYGMTYEDTFTLILECCTSYGDFYFDTFKERCRSYNDLGGNSDNREEEDQGKALGAFLSVYPSEYLSYVLNAKPAKFMLDKLEELKNDTGLPNPVINVIIDYSLKKTNGSFNEKYIDKVAYSVKMNNITTAYETMVFLNTHDFEKKSLKTKKTTKKKVEEEVDEEMAKELRKKVKL